MRLIDDLVITEDSRTVYLVVLHPKILPIDYFQLFYSPPKRNRRQWLCKILGGVKKLHYGLCEMVNEIKALEINATLVENDFRMKEMNAKKRVTFQNKVN